MLLIKILGVLFLVSGSLGIFFSPLINEKFGVWKNVKCDFEEELDSDDIVKYRKMRASVNVKMIGMIVFLPGLVLLLIAFS